ncbi:MAG: aminoglycoside phosphotransferase family protein [Bifidobacterium subtile]|jgi:hypothetical protein|nr:aminoglycoside phosphotransferase family protein [Bifidobacterium subtile]MCI1258879.1 aminoglycoside phosphotransferase family protein [Bifidobacterium subtile]
MTTSTGRPRIESLIDAVLGARPGTELFRYEHLSLALGLLLDDGRAIVVKVRPYERRHAACSDVQRVLYAAGFPCPELLAGPIESDDSAVLPSETPEAYSSAPCVARSSSAASWSVSMERYVEPPAGDARGFAPTARLSGEALCRLMSLASHANASAMPSLAPPPAWLAWNHPEPGFWPAPDDGDEDLNAIDAPDWLNEAAHHVREVLQSASARPVIGHGDWESQNVFWGEGRLAAVHDWDSIVALPEPAIVGAAAGVFAVKGSEPSWPTLKNSQDFLAGYLASRGCDRVGSGSAMNAEWAKEYDRIFWAAGLWVHCFNAQKALARGASAADLERTRLLIRERLALTGSQDAMRAQF